MLERDAKLKFDSENPYIAQSESFKEGMRYFYSPDTYPINQAQYQKMIACGTGFGKILDKRFENSIIEFRLDFVKDRNGEIFVTEVQTDDRGLPAIVITRNSKGLTQPKLLPGVAENFAKSIKQKTEKQSPSLAIIFPQNESFYYAGFYDFARISQLIDPEVTINVFSDNEVETIKGNIITTKALFDGSKFITGTDLIWDFAGTETDSISLIQPIVYKDLLKDIWTLNDPSLETLKTYVPEVTDLKDPRVENNKNDWILKLEKGRWSKGIVMGVETQYNIWKEALKNPDLLAQKFIFQPKEEFSIRKKSGSFETRDFYSRIEGYYIKVDGSWILADILATCTPRLPVHGQKECIMITGEIR